jgi:uncharacterized membrane-anchored protein
VALGVGLGSTAIIFTVVTAVVLGVQMRLRHYLPGAYWLTVVMMSITGTLYTDLLIDQAGVPLWVSAGVFSAGLAVVFAIWLLKERTLSIHSIATRPREAFYWLAVLVTFALGTALGDWTLELTGWGPGFSILLPLVLIGVVTALWRFGANPVLAFWIAYILTRPLGANIGDWLGLTTAEGGLGLGALLTSIIFLAAILATVVYLSIRKPTWSNAHPARQRRQPPRTPANRVGHPRGGCGCHLRAPRVHQQPPAHERTRRERSGTELSGRLHRTDAVRGPIGSTVALPASNVAELRTITSDALTLVKKGDKSAAAAHATDLETAWDDNQQALNAADCAAWTFIGKQIDPVLSAVRSHTPNLATEQTVLNSSSRLLEVPDQAVQVESTARFTYFREVSEPLKAAPERAQVLQRPLEGQCLNNAGSKVVPTGRAVPGGGTGHERSRGSGGDRSGPTRVSAAAPGTGQSVGNRSQKDGW